MDLLAPHQKAAIQACLNAIYFGSNEHPGSITRMLISMATGSGKTRTAAGFAAEYLQPGQRLLYVVHQEDLYKQAIREFSKFFPAQLFGVVQGENNQPNKPFVFATVQTIQQTHRMDELIQTGKFDLIVLDECHRALAESWKRVVRRASHSDTVVLGMTATPMRSDGQSLRQLFEECVYSVGMLDLIAMDPPLLCDLRSVQVIVPDLDLSQVKRADDGDFDDAALALAVAKSKLRHKSAVDAIYRYIPRDWPGLAFCTDVKDAIAYANVCNAAGIATEVIHSLTKKADRERIEKDFDEGRIRQIANVKVYTEGKDKPRARFIVMLAHTASQGRYVQSIGRGVRVLDEDRGKPYSEWSKQYCLVIDVADNHHSVLVLPDMVGTTEEKMARKSVRELVEEKVIQPPVEPKEIIYKPGHMQLHMTANSMFTTRQWKPIGMDKRVWECDSRVGGKAVVERDFAGYLAYYESPTGQKRHIKQVPTKVEHAFGAAELYLKDLENKAERKEQLRTDSGTRSLPASPAQIAKLRQVFKNAIDPKRQYTQGEVQDHWDQLKQAGSVGNWYKQFGPGRFKKGSTTPTTLKRSTTPKSRNPLDRDLDFSK